MIRPYFKSAVEVAGRLDRQQQPSKLPSKPRVMSFIHFGIVDCSTVEDDSVLDFARDLAYRIRTTDEVVYLHCWGGHGRTGTVVCLLLCVIRCLLLINDDDDRHILYGLDATQALYRCQFVHDLRRIP
jgi:protein tyrosine phosphatase